MKRYFQCSLCFLFFLFTALVFPMVTNGFSALDIPEPVQCYFSAVAESDLNALTQCFQDAAVIIDVNRKILGIEAIRSWANNEVIGGRYEIFPILQPGFAIVTK